MSSMFAQQFSPSNTYDHLTNSYISGVCPRQKYPGYGLYEYKMVLSMYLQPNEIFEGNVVNYLGQQFVVSIIDGVVFVELI